MPQQQPAHPLLALPKLSLERDREAMTATATAASPTVVTTPTTTTGPAAIAAGTAAAVAAGGMLSPSATSCSGLGPTSSPANSPMAMATGASASSNAGHALSLSSAQLPTFTQGAPASAHAASPLSHMRDYHSLETTQEQLARPGHHPWSSTEHCSSSDTYDRLDGASLGRSSTLTRIRSSSTSQQQQQQPHHQQHRRIRSLATPHPSTESSTSSSTGSLGMLDVSVAARRRTQSAQYSPSIRLALADPTLSKSLQSSPVSSRSSWEHVQQQNAKKRFEANVRRYYHQLVVGCERSQGECLNRLCRTSRYSPRLTNDAAAILSVQLAARPRLFFCEHCPANPPIELPQSPFSGCAGTANSPSTAAPASSKGSHQLPRSVSSGALAKKKAAHLQSASASTATTTSQRAVSHNGLYARSQLHHHHGSGLYPPRRQPSDQVSARPPLLTRSSPSLRHLAEQDMDQQPQQHHHHNQHPYHQAQLENASRLPPLPPSSSMSSSSSSSSSSRKPFFDSVLSLSPFSKMFAVSSDPSSSASFSSSSSLQSQSLSNTSRQHQPLENRLQQQAAQPATAALQCSSHNSNLTLKADLLDQKEEDDEGVGYINKCMRSPLSSKSSKLALKGQEPRQSISSSRCQRRHNRSRIISPSTSSPPSSSSSDEEEDRRIAKTGLSRRTLPRLYGENRVGLGVFPMSMIGSRTVCEDHDIYYPSPLRILSGGKCLSSKQRGSRRPRRISKNHRLIFGSSRDPDSDGSLSNSSRSLSDEEEENSDVLLSRLNDCLSGVNIKNTLNSTTTIQQAEHAWDGEIDSAASSDSEDALCLGFMNLQLLRQAIATYNSSRLDDTLSLNLAPSVSEPHLLSSVTSKDAATTAVSKNKAIAISTTYHHSQSTPSLRRSPSWSTISSDDDQSPLEKSSGYSNAVTASVSGAAAVSSAIKAKRDQGDSRFLLESIRAVFSSASALGSSFLVSGEASETEIGSTINVGGIDVGSLREAYEMLIELEPSSLFSIHGTNAIEILLARLELEMIEGGQVSWGEFEMRAIFILLMNPYLFEQPYQESLLNRTLAIFVALPAQDKLVEWISHLDEEGMAQLVTLFKMYLSAHFTPKPKGDHHPAVCAVKALDILYRANEMHTQRIRRIDCETINTSSHDEYPLEATKSQSAEGLSYKYFYSDVIERLQFKDEYRIWRESVDPSTLDREFSYFAYPFLISPSCKAHIVNLDAMNQMSAFYEEACVRHAMLAQTQRLFSDAISSTTTEVQKGIRAITSPYLVLELSRSNIVQEAFDQLVAKHADLKKPLKVAFVDVGEEGMDQGGVTKEFFQVMLERVFDSKFGLFKELDDQTRAWWIEGTLDGSSAIAVSEEDIGARLVEYELVGILIGLALYNGVILGVRFPSILYRKLLGWPVDLQSFTESFPQLGHGLRQMLEWSDGDVYDIFMRNFEISYEHMDQVMTLPLVPGGEDVAVTNDNRQHYVALYMDHYANVHVAQEFTAFQRGFLKICDGDALKMLRPEELELLLCGNPSLDMHDLELACLYDDGYSAHHELMQEFWDIVHNEMTSEQHKQLLAFVTGSDRVPIRGLRDLVFVIQRNGPDSDRLPTALTCFSRLLLPEYSSRDKMKERLVTAIENSHGFGLV